MRSVLKPAEDGELTPSGRADQEPYRDEYPEERYPKERPEEEYDYPSVLAGAHAHGGRDDEEQLRRGEAPRSLHSKRSPANLFRVTECAAAEKAYDKARALHDRKRSQHTAGAVFETLVRLRELQADLGLELGAPATFCQSSVFAD